MNNRLGIYFTEHNPGGAKPIVLLHGLGVTGNSWQLQIPTLHLDIQSELAAGIRSARQVVIPEAGHAVIADQTDGFNRVLLDFLTEAAAHRAG